MGTNLIDDFLVEQVRQLPDSPGVYFMKDAEGTVLYVGKAASLRHRVGSYFGNRQKLSPKLNRMMARVSDLDFLVTGSEQEALIMECTLIKRHRPYYNVRLKDDKTFPYIKICLNEDWPRIYVTRLLDESQAHYFGPFASVKSIRQTLKVLKTIFPFRSCSRAITGHDRRPCLEYYLKHCAAPCIGAVSKKEYAEIVKQVILFLEGKQERIMRTLKNQMKKAAETLDFEKASQIRDQVQAIESVIEGQRIATTVRGEQDVIAFASDKDRAYVLVLFIRNGKLVGRENFVLQGTSSEEPGQIMTSFIKQFYGSSPYLPPRLLLQYPVEDKTVIENWLQSRRGSRVYIQVPRRGSKKQLMNIAIANAEQGLQLLKIRHPAAPSSTAAVLAELQSALHLPHLPSRIECYDISNIQGKAAVGSMVVFTAGEPKPAHYRRFRIRTVSGANDYAMLQEVLSRRFKRKHQNNKNADQRSTWDILPDLILIDGGKGQLNAVLAVLNELSLESLPVASIAKEHEEIFIRQQKEAITLPDTSPELHLLQRIRDEAHRFAISYHRKIRRRETFTSALDAIPGIGPNRKRALLQQFGSVPAISRASITELAATRGLSPGLAQKIKRGLAPQSEDDLPPIVT